MSFQRKQLTDEYFIDSDPRVQMELLRTALSNRLGYSVDDSDPAFLIACSCLPPICQSLAKADLMIKQTMTQFATGTALEAIATDLGITRHTATRAKFSLPLTYSDSGTSGHRDTLVCGGTFRNPHTGEDVCAWSFEGTCACPSSTVLKTTIEVQADSAQYVPPYCVCVVDDGQTVFTPHSSSPSTTVTLGGTGGFFINTGADDEGDDALAERCYNTRTGLRYYGSLKWMLAMLQNAGHAVADICYCGTTSSGKNGISICMYNDTFNSSSADLLAARLAAIGYLGTSLAIPGDNLEYVPPVRMGDGTHEAKITITIYRDNGDTATEDAAKKAVDEWKADGCSHFGMLDLASLSAYLKEKVPAVSYITATPQYLPSTAPANAGIAVDQIVVTFADSWWR